MRIASLLNYRCDSVPVIFVRRNAQENASMEAGSRATANSNKINSGRAIAPKPAPSSNAARIASSAYVTGFKMRHNLQPSGKDAHGE